MEHTRSATRRHPKYGTPIYVNQPVIFITIAGLLASEKEGVMRTSRAVDIQKPQRGGRYLRPFTVPESWDGREIYIEFDGVDSFFYLWINGKYVGFSKNSRNAARFDITPMSTSPVRENMLAVEVYRSSDGSFLEDSRICSACPVFFRSVLGISPPRCRSATWWRTHSDQRLQGRSSQA